MMGALTGRVWLAALCSALISLGVGAMPAQAAFDDPEFVFFPEEDEIVNGNLVAGVPPGTGIHDACGLAVSIAGNFYVSDYYHNNVDVFKPTTPVPPPVPPADKNFITQLSGVDPLSGPCGLALDTAGALYVNSYHHNVKKFASLSGTGTVIDSGHSTGVAVNQGTSNVYVNDRTYVAGYDSSGAPLLDGGDPLQIGLGSLGDAYGLAISRYISTINYIYVPDAATDTVKVFNPAVDLEDPVAEITGPPGGFEDLTDSAVAVDRASGEIYVADQLGSRLTEHPETAIYVFDSAGAYEGRLKYNVIDGSPVGLAVDNSTGVNQGRVYVTSGNSEFSSVYAYPPEAATIAEEPAVFSLSIGTSGSGEGSVTAKLAGIECSGSCSGEAMAGAQVSLAATPEQGSSFEGWSGGGCSGTGTCTVQMTEATSVGAEFEGTAPGPVPGVPAAAAAAAIAPAPMSAPGTSEEARGKSAKQRRRAKQRRAARKRHLAKQRRNRIEHRAAQQRG